MYCDSAYFFEQTNSLEAFSNVRMEQGDTLFVYGNYLFYDGNTQIAYLRENVRMENGQVTLFTDSLNYERIPDIGYYFDGGLIVDSLNQLSSFTGNIRLVRNWLSSMIASVWRMSNSRCIPIPCIIIRTRRSPRYSDHPLSCRIAARSILPGGWYDTVNNTSLLLDRSPGGFRRPYLDGRLYRLQPELGFGEAFGNMSLQDTAQHVMLEGQYGFTMRRPSMLSLRMAPRFLEFSQGDTLFLHGDTLKMTTVDSHREVKAYYGVRFYRTDMQGVCDSMQFNTRDSILYMYTDPIVWNEQYQIYGDTILIFMNDSSIDFAHVKQFAFAIQQNRFYCVQSIKGNDLKAYFEGQVVNQIDVSGNAESIFFPLEKDGSMVGMNETKSGFLTIWLKDNKLDKLKIWPTPTGTMTPIPDLKPDQKYLKDFYWFDYIRPKDKDDIYQVVKRKAQDAPKRSNKFVH